MLSLRSYQQEAVTKILACTDKTILVNASVGSGKSLILSTVLLDAANRGIHCLCSTLHSTINEQNSRTYRAQGGKCSIYCAGLHSKSFDEKVVFASVHSICQSLRDELPISQIQFGLIVIDECHNIGSEGMYIRILNHYGARTLIGLTGTPYRGKSSIIGPNELFKQSLVNIPMPWLIEQGYLVKPVFNPTRQSLDFSRCKVQANGRFNPTELQSCADERLTGQIMRELIQLPHSGVFIFCVSIKHCEEAMRSLPPNESAMITGQTPHTMRAEIIAKAKAGIIRYLVNVNVLTVGIDVPNFDHCAWLRPTESLTLFTQGIGRVLRLSPGKSRAVVLDYAQNLDRHGDIDDPIINEAIQPKPNDPDYIIPCFTCGTCNSIFARRCIGNLGNQRCDYFFDFKPCPRCETQNDTSARYCRHCQAELVDPNTKLRLLPNQTIVTVERIQYHISSTAFSIYYNGNILESYNLVSQRALNVFYGSFVKKYVRKPSSYYMHLRNTEVLKKMVTDIMEPKILVLENGKIKRKIL